MQGPTIVATGATSGIGEAAVEALARGGARILLIARDRVRAEATLARLGKAGPKGGHRALFADLSLMSEARRVGAQIAADEARVDVLINNAGASFPTRRLTAEGLESTFALNHMSYFVLTQALLAPLKAAGRARIVSTTSAAHFRATLDFDDLQLAKGYGPWRAYANSKLCNVLFTRELARRLAGTGVTANCAHPGVVSTRIWNTTPVYVWPFVPLLRLLARPPRAGGDGIAWLASAPDAAAFNGEYFVDRKVAPMSAVARDDEVAARLGATPMQVALAWLLHRAENILLIPGTSSLAHLRENLAAAEIELPPDAVAELDGVGRLAAK